MVCRRGVELDYGGEADHIGVGARGAAPWWEGVERQESRVDRGRQSSEPCGRVVLAEEGGACPCQRGGALVNFSCGRTISEEEETILGFREGDLGRRAEADEGGVGR